MTATPAGMTYADYLKLDQLLTAQQPLSELHDEMLFIIIHQTKELWMKELLHELELAIRLIEEDRFAEAYKAMARISRIQAVMTLSWDVLSTLTPVDYMKFRDVLGTSSGTNRICDIMAWDRRSGRSSRSRSKNRAFAKRQSRRCNAPASMSGTLRFRRSPLPGSRSTATPIAGSNCMSSPRN
jgi:hypothetical protein